jgi:hypothetical protein
MTKPHEMCVSQKGFLLSLMIDRRMIASLYSCSSLTLSLSHLNKTGLLSFSSFSLKFQLSSFLFFNFCLLFPSFFLSFVFCYLFATALSLFCLGMPADRQFLPSIKHLLLREEDDVHPWSGKDYDHLLFGWYLYFVPHYL